MPKPRSTLVSLDATPYYHCVSRCVRRAFLCGTDHHTGQSYEHRREWIQTRLFQLTEVFAIEVSAYAVMSNHVHTVLFIDAERASTWTDSEVVARWHQLFSGTALSHRYLSGDREPALMALLQPQIDEYRRRLQDISWFNRCLNEQIARKANTEDQCTGRFWEGRFKCQALLDEKALLSCMAYVDLNPIRSNIAKTPEASEFTSIKDRIDQINNTSNKAQPDHLQPFVGDERMDMPAGIPFKLKDYMELIDWTGRVIREDKRGHIPDIYPPILSRLNIEPKQWHELSQRFEANFKNFVGEAVAIKENCARQGYKRSPGVAISRALFQ